MGRFSGAFGWLGGLVGRKALLPLALLALAALTRAPGLLRRALNYEEALCWFYARIPLRVQWERDIRGPLNYASLAPVARAFPRPEPVRVVSFSAGTAVSLLPMFVPGGLSTFGRAMASAFLALSPPLVRQSQDADGCSLALLAEGLALLLALSYASIGGRWRLAGYGLLSLLAPQIHPVFLWSLLGRGLLFLVAAVHGSRRGRTLFASTLPGVVASLLVLSLQRPPSGGGGWLKAVASLLLVLVEPSTGFETALREASWAPLLWPLGVGTSLIALLGAGALWRRGLGWRAAVLSGLGAALLFPLASWLRGLSPLARYLLPLLLPLSLCFGAGAELLPRRARWLLGATFLAQVLGSAAYLLRPYYGVDWRETARALERNVKPGEPVVLHPPAAGLILRHYLADRRLDIRPRGTHWFTAKGFFVGPEGRPFRPDWRRGALDAARHHGRSVWVLFWSLSPAGRKAPRRLDGLELDRLIPLRGYAESATLARYRRSPPRGKEG